MPIVPIVIAIASYRYLILTGLFGLFNSAPGAHIPVPIILNLSARI